MRFRHVSRLLAGALVLFGLTAGQAFASSPAAPAAPQRSAPSVVNAYLGILNAGMQSGSFAALSTVYAPQAVFTVANPAGQVLVFHGLTKIEGFYAMVRKNEKRPHFTIEKMRLLDPSTVYTYEHAGHAGETLPARCTHLYVIKDGLIVRDDFVVFFPGKE
jgi:SnoaL-like domain